MPAAPPEFPNLSRDNVLEWCDKVAALWDHHPEEFHRWHDAQDQDQLLHALRHMFDVAENWSDEELDQAPTNPPTTCAPPLPHPQHHYYLPPSPPAPPKLQFQPFMATQVELTGLAGVEGEAEEGWYEDDVNGVMLWERGEGNTWWVRSARQDWWMRMVWGVYSIWWGAPERSH
ncbi:unnamed protein product [Vitrella brassicaformis CCMP3155]|uniref:Uncharacterized protein n=1 Tax=Vitrella brassicaformis (strain CCMP3155) TaxID=1169540 RepID=A0A0G4EJM5_VITBC|nr:unnamed protein product [Vitrella brassicaformis CCMP3155]|eukprot:CEL97630.1 unnamed protein product [Vitrella brassicaformis CCMP3155]